MNKFTRIAAIGLVGLLLAGCNKHTHTLKWTSDESAHWEVCEECDYAGEKADHSYDAGVVTTEPTYTSTGVKTFTCSVCGHTKTEEVAKLTPTKLASPVITFTATGVEIAPVEHGTIMVSLTAVDWEVFDAADYTWDKFTEVSEYSVCAKAVSSEDAYSDSDTVLKAFESVKTSLTVSRTAVDTIKVDDWKGLSLKIKHNKGEWADMTETTYKATSSEVCNIKAVGGFDVENKKLYIDDVEKSASLLCAPASELDIYSVGEKGASDVADDWVVKKYNNGWVDTTATIGTEVGYDGVTNVCQLNCWNNYTTFKYSTSYETIDLYNQLSFVVKGDGIATIKIRLTNSTTGVYMTGNLGKLAKAWYDVTISMADTNWKIAFNGGEYTFEEIKAQAGLISAAELIAGFDTFEVITYGETSNGENAKLFIGEIKAQYVSEPKTDATEKTSVPVERLKLDFEDGTVGQAYVNSSWTCEQYKQVSGTSDYAWQTGGSMNCRSKGGSSAVNFVANNWGASRYTYTIPSAITVNKFVCTVWNDFSTNADLSVKITLITSSNSTTYLLGSSSTWYTVPAGAAAVPVSLDFNTLSNVAYLRVTVQSSLSSAYLYVDNVSLIYVP